MATNGEFSVGFTCPKRADTPSDKHLAALQSQPKQLEMRKRLLHQEMETRGHTVGPFRPKKPIKYVLNFEKVKKIGTIEK